MKTIDAISLLAAALVLSATTALASMQGEDAVPAQVPPETSPRKVCCCPHGATCRLVRECEERKKTVWVVECEWFCPVLPKLPRLWPAGKSPTGGCAVDGGAWGEAAPVKCGKARTVKRLVKKEVTYYVPRYRCVVCGCTCAAPEAEPLIEAAPVEPDSDSSLQ